MEANKKTSRVNKAWTQLSDIFEEKILEDNEVIEIDGVRVSPLGLFGLAEKNDKAFDIIKKVRIAYSSQTPRENEHKYDFYRRIVRESIGDENIKQKTTRRQTNRASHNRRQDPPRHERTIIPQEVRDAISALEGLPTIDLDEDEIFYHEQRKSLKIREIINIALEGNSYAQQTIINYAEIMVGAYEDELDAQQARDEAHERRQERRHTQSNGYSQASSENEDHDEAYEEDDVISFIEDCIHDGLNQDQVIKFKSRGGSKRRTLKDVLDDARNSSNKQKQEIAIEQLKHLKERLLKWRAEQTKQYAKQNASHHNEGTNKQSTEKQTSDDQRENFEEAVPEIDEQEYLDALSYMNGLFEDDLISKFKTVRVGTDNMKVWSLVKQANKYQENLNPYYKVVMINLRKEFEPKEEKLRVKAQKRKQREKEADDALKEAFSELASAGYLLIRLPDRLSSRIVKAGASFLESWRKRETISFGVFAFATIGLLGYQVMRHPEIAFSQPQILRAAIDYQNSDAYEGSPIVNNNIYGCTPETFSDEMPTVYQAYLNYMGDRFGVNSALYLQAMAFVDQSIYLHDEGIVDGYVNPQLHFLLVQRETGFRDAHNPGTDAAGQGQFIKTTFEQEARELSQYSALYNSWEEQGQQDGTPGYALEQYHAIERYLSGQGGEDIDEQMFQNMRYWSFATQIITTKIAMDNPELLLDADTPSPISDANIMLDHFQVIYDPHLGGDTGGVIINDPALQDVGVLEFDTIKDRIEASNLYTDYDKSVSYGLSRYWAQRAPTHNSFIRVQDNPTFAVVHDRIYESETSTAYSPDGLSNIQRALTVVDGWNTSNFELCVDQGNPYVQRLRDTVIVQDSIADQIGDKFNGLFSLSWRWENVSMPDLNFIQRTQASELSPSDTLDQTAQTDTRDGIEPPSRRPENLGRTTSAPSTTYRYSVGAFGDPSLRVSQVRAALGDGVRIQFEEAISPTGQPLQRVVVSTDEPNLCSPSPGGLRGACRKLD